VRRARASVARAGRPSDAAEGGTGRARTSGAAVGAGEPVQVGLGPSGVPLEFIWRGRRHRVRSVDGWRPATATLGVTVSVRTDRGLRCTLAQDTAGLLWRVGGVRRA
jgi:hypothetical protein